MGRTIHSPSSANASAQLSLEDLKELQHFAQLGRLSASLLHEISNPLTAALIDLERPDEPADDIRHARRSLKLLKRYVEAARRQVQLSSQPISFRVDSQLRQLKRVVKPLAQRAGVSLKIEAADNYALHGDPIKFQHVLANLIVNAIDAYAHDTSQGLARPVVVKLSARRAVLTIEVSDWGEGIAASQFPLVFKPFYTTKSQDGHGLGIGLYMVRQYVVVDFHGSVQVFSSRRAGTRFILRLPIKSDA